MNLSTPLLAFSISLLHLSYSVLLYFFFISKDITIKHSKQTRYFVIYLHKPRMYLSTNGPALVN